MTKVKPRDILEALDAAGDYAVPQRTLISALALLLPCQPTGEALDIFTAETVHELKVMTARAQVVKVEDEDRGDMWKITSQGRARLQS